MRVHLVLKSSNAKTGQIPVSTSSSETCPDICPFKSKGCYASSGPLLLHWRKVSSGERGQEWNTFCEAIADLPSGQLWRHNQAGDLPGDNGKVDSGMLRTLMKANTGKRGFTYTHKPVLGETIEAVKNRIAVREANQNGFTINLSGNNPGHADDLAALGIAPVVTVLPSDQNNNLTTPNGRKIVVCPATQRDDVSCATCQLCSKANRSCIVGFPAHGTYKKQANEIAKVNFPSLAHRRTSK